MIPRLSCRLRWSSCPTVLISDRHTVLTALLSLMNLCRRGNTWVPRHDNFDVSTISSLHHNIVVSPGDTCAGNRDVQVQHLGPKSQKRLGLARLQYFSTKSDYPSAGNAPEVPKCRKQGLKTKNDYIPNPNRACMATPRSATELRRRAGVKYRLFTARPALWWRHKR